jgi:hypothetical protein
MRAAVEKSPRDETLENAGKRTGMQPNDMSEFSGRQTGKLPNHSQDKALRSRDTEFSLHLLGHALQAMFD